MAEYASSALVCREKLRWMAKKVIVYTNFAVSADVT